MIEILFFCVESLKFQFMVPVKIEYYFDYPEPLKLRMIKTLDQIFSSLNFYYLLFSTEKIKKINNT